MWDKDLPPNWETNTTHLCGISLLPSGPDSNISACCAAPVEVSNDCWQYCQTILPGHEFHQCLTRNLDIGNFGTRCNFADEASDISGPPSSKMSWDVSIPVSNPVVLGALLAVVVLVLIKVGREDRV